MRIVYSNQSDEALMELVLAKKSDTAFYALYSRYWDKLFALAAKILNDDDAAKDCVQEVYTSLWNRKSKKADILNVKAYLFKATRFQIARYLRHSQVQDVHLEDIESLQSENNTEAQINLKDLEQHINQQLESLPPASRRVFEMSRFEQLSNAEIAQKLQISISTVENHINKALKILRNNLKVSAGCAILMAFIA